MAVPRSQIPLNREIVDAKGRVTTPWAFWFQTLYQLAPPVGESYVIDGSYSTYGQSTMFQGNDSAKGTPLNGYIYIAVDSGKIYTEQSGAWQVQVPAYSGDASSQPFSTTLVLEADQPNIQTLLNLTQISVSGNATIGNVIATGNFIGDGSQLSNLTGANVVGQVANALVAGTVYTNAQPNITSVGTLTSLSVSGNVTANYFFGNGAFLTGIASNRIYNGTSNVEIATANGNITFAVDGVSNVANISNTTVTVKDLRITDISIHLGLNSANSGQYNSIAIGEEAGYDLQGLPAVAGRATAIGYQAGYYFQGGYATAIGTQSGNNSQGERATAIGYQAGFDLQQNDAIAIGTGAGYANQTYNGVAIGFQAGSNAQQASATAIGENAGANLQTEGCVAIGSYAGNDNQGNSVLDLGYAVAIGLSAGFANQGGHAVSIGYRAGQFDQGDYATAIGEFAGRNYQNTFATAIGPQAGYDNQGANATAIGAFAGYGNQSVDSVAIGSYAGYSSQSGSAVAIGFSAGRTAQTTEATAIGYNAGYNAQGYAATAIGSAAGQESQSYEAVAIGYNAGYLYQNPAAIAIGSGAGYNSQGEQSIAIGYNAGYLANANSISIGAFSGGGTNPTANNAIVINATGAALENTTANSLVVKPIRQASTANILYYSNTTGEVSYHSTTEITQVGTLTSLSVTGNVDTSGNLNATERLFYKRTYGSFTSNVTQNTAGANALNYMTFNNTELANGISIANSSNITIERTGIYNIQFSAQITHPDNQPANVEIWLDKNGTAIANTNTRLTIAKDVAVVAAWNFVEQFSTANDYFRLGWASSEANAQLTAIPSANSIANVAIPSVILTVTPVGA